MAKKHNCTACHAVDKKIVGPSYKDVAAKHKGDAGAAAKLAEKVKKGGAGVYGPIPMPPNPAVPDADVEGAGRLDPRRSEVNAYRATRNAGAAVTGRPFFV